jgi:hypothetical protein
MKIHQLLIFVENKPGHLIAACGVLAGSSINVLGNIVLFERQERSSWLSAT